ncbi:MAG TPA: hypothetical protein EYQ09_04545 [Flavobacteriales bacterium]|nr:hypothetical protein [Flavobacteriales bacterium]
MKKLLFSLLTAVIGGASYGQSILANDIRQGEKLIEAYFTPMAESFGGSLNNGWYNTAKPHSLGGFDITFTLNTVIIPNTAETFNIKDAGGNTFTSNETEASTIFGSKETTTMYYNSVELPQGGGKFEMPGGFNIPAMPLPMIQAGIGLIRNTAIDIRYMPMMNVGDNFNVNLFGIGLKHDLLQWIPAIGDAIPMSLSLQGGYTTLNTELKISGQEVSLNTKATTINLIASKKLLMLTGYAGVGYNSSTTTFAADANFDLGGVQFNEKIEVAFESNKNLRANIGLRLNITLVTIQADYTFSEYPTATLGLGVSLR